MFNHCEINATTGVVTREVTDFLIPSRCPMQFVRRYSSSEDGVGPLGSNWATNYVSSATLTDDAFVLHDALNGDESIAFGADLDVDGARLGLSKYDATRLSAVRPLTRRRDASGDDAIVVERRSGVRDFYARFRQDPGAWCLAARTDPFGNTLSIRYRGDNPVAIEFPEGNVLVLDWNAAGLIARVAFLEGGTNTPLAAMRYGYDEAYDLTSCLDERARAESRYEYSDHLLVKSIDAAGGARHYAFDAERRCVHAWFESGLLERTLRFDDLRHQRLVGDSYGSVTLLRCSDDGELVEHVDPNGDVTTRILDRDGGVIATVDPDGSVEDLFSYDASTHELRTTSAGGGMWRTTFDGQRQVIAITAPSGCKRRHEYDEYGRLIRVTLPNQAVISYAYGRHGLVASTTDPLGYEIGTDLSDDGRLVRFWDRIGPLYEQYFDGYGNLLKEIDAAGRETTFRYATNDFVSVETEADGVSRRFEYDGVQNTVSETNALGRTWTTEYDEVGNVTAERDPLGHRIRYRYDLECNLIEVINEKGESTRIERDGVYREVRTRFFDGRIQQFEEDSLDRRTAIIDADGRRTALTYQPDGDIHSRRFFDGAVETYGLDQDGRYASIALDEPVQQGRRSRVATFEYDGTGNLIATTHEGRTVKYEWDLAGTLTALRDSLGDETHFTRDERHFISALTAGGRRFSFSRLPTGEIVELRYPNGLVQRFTYDATGWMIARTMDGPDGQPKTWRRYEYDAARQLVSTTDWRSGVTRFEYDACGRLIAARHEATGVTETYSYDPAGNLVDTPAGPGVVSAGNRLVRAGGDELTYDADGRLVGRRGQAGTWQYEWDRDEQLARVRRDGEMVAEFEYDLVNRRHRKITPDDSTEFLYETYALRAEILSDGRRRHYVSLPSMPVYLGVREGDEWLFYSWDHLGAPAEVFDERGEIVAIVRAGAYGADRTVDRMTGADVQVPFALPGQFVDQETGLAYNHHRYYAPDLGRFISQDPLRFDSGPNFYCYPQNPLTGIDPLGLLQALTFTCKPHWGPCQQWYARQKVARINRASSDRIIRKTCTSCPDTKKGRKNKQREDFEDKCGGGPGSAGVGRQVDHMHELQAGGYDRCCNNLRSVEENFNRDLGNVFQTETLAGLNPGQFIGKIKCIGCKTKGKCSKAGQNAVAKKPPKGNSKCSKEDSKPIRC